MNPSNGDSARLRQGLVPITTTALGPASYHAQLNTPISAVSMASSHLQSGHNTPVSAIQPYNPQEWMPSPGVSGVERGSTYAPPPYSPPRSQHQPRATSGSYDQRPGATTTTPPPNMMRTSGVHRPSPEPGTNQSFPPPPGGRGNSRERRFGLSSLGRRRDAESQQAGSPDPRQLARQSMGPVPSQIFDMERTQTFIQNAPPGARRAASTGAIETPTSARSRSSSQTRWDPGMPLPPPPPGPPPAASRSQSVQPMESNTVPIISPPTRRRQTASFVSTLGPVPPTPAAWPESSQAASAAGTSSEVPPPLASPDLRSTSRHSVEVEASSSGSGALSRTGAVRHDKTILQRRAESRSRHGSRQSIDERIQPQQISDIKVTQSPENSLRAALGKAPYSDGRDSSGLQDSRNSTPRALGSAKTTQTAAATPPFSPYPAKPATQNYSQPAAPKSLPTPPPMARSASGSRPRDSSRPPPAMMTPVSKHMLMAQTAEQFASATIERFSRFAAAEAVADSDAARVRLFADFMVNESRLRRERYGSAIGAMGSEIFDLTRDLFRPMNAARRESGTSQEEWTPQSSEPNRSHRGSIGSAAGPSNSAPASAGTPISPSGGPPANVNWSSNYMPSLSPILSMSVSDNYENGSSRGRPPSRWWESSSQGDPSKGLERSKRESKYMGVPKNQWVDEEAAGPKEEYGSRFPPEKVGWHEQQQDAEAAPQPLRLSSWPVGYQSPTPINPESLDVSRLVTMPPPYPRHHPAVNNNHPELTTIRTTVRALSDFAELNEAREKFTIGSSRRREEADKVATDRQQALRVNLQQEIAAGNLGYADAAAIESDTKEDENNQKKEVEKLEYEHFQNEVIQPLNTALTERIARATDLFDDLSRRLFQHGQNDADMPQEEGDDRPELLEKLTLLKWIFEARELLHRAIYDLLSDRNSRYCEVVVTPYRLSGNTEKLKSAEAFFAEDAAKREFSFSNEVLDRARDFRAVVQEAVDRGVALQLSAFWDIAPPLRNLLDSIPMDLRDFYVQIPTSELEENPSYGEYPLQYLFSLLLHAEKSTYQFIEAHTNLLCLLHEVKEAVAHAKARVLATQVLDADGTQMCNEDREQRAKAMREAEDRRLTEDLKEKVRTVQDQWQSALGEGFKGVKERAGERLLQTGGWDESFEEAGLVGV